MTQRKTLTRIVTLNDLLESELAKIRITDAGQLKKEIEKLKKATKIFTRKVDLILGERAETFSLLYDAVNESVDEILSKIE